MTDRCFCCDLSFNGLFNFVCSAIVVFLALAYMPLLRMVLHHNTKYILYGCVERQWASRTSSLFRIKRTTKKWP